MKCPMKFSVGCSSESKECEGQECMWYMNAKPDGASEGNLVRGCAVAFSGMAIDGVLYTISSCEKSST